MFAIAGRCRRSLLLHTVSRSLTEPTLISRDADLNSRSSTIRNSAMAMKSRRVLQGQSASRNAFAMLQLSSYRICCCWGSSAVRWRGVLSSALSSAIVFLASANLVCRVLMASDFVFTRLSLTCWLPVGDLSVACRFSVGQLSADCWPTVGRLSVEGRCSSQLPCCVLLTMQAIHNVIGFFFSKFCHQLQHPGTVFTASLWFGHFSCK